MRSCSLFIGMLLLHVVYSSTASVGEVAKTLKDLRVLLGLRHLLDVSSYLLYLVEGILFRLFD
jgi:hypothetical protein